MMDERDYLQMAKKKSDEEIMNDYWTKIAVRKVWISKDGTETKFSDLEIGHMLNIINGLLTFKNENCKDVISALISELIVRIKRKMPRYAFEALDTLYDLAKETNPKEADNAKEILLEQLNKYR